MKKIFSLVTVSMLTMAMLFTLPVKVFAASTDQPDELFDLSKSNSLSVVYHADQDDVDGTDIQLYKVAQWSERYDYTLTEAFAACGFNPEKVESNDEWQTIADTLDAYVKDQSPEASKQTKIAGGKASFEDLEPGLYFIPQTVVQEENGYRTFTHVLVNLPDVVDSEWVYDVETAPKSELFTPTYKDIDYFINVVWDDAGYEKYRPNSVVAHITHSGGPEGDGTVVVRSTETDNAPKPAVYGMAALKTFVSLLSVTEDAPETDDAAPDEVPSDVTISSDMNWHYEWTTKDDGTEWNVNGSEVEHYTLTVKTVERGWILEYHVIPDPSPVPKTGEDFPLIPVVLLSISGIILVVFGIVSRRKAND